MHNTLNAFVVADPSKCIGCRVCEVACAVEHAAPGALTAGVMDVPVIPRLYLVREPDVVLPVQCRHCEDAPCAAVCPVDAITQQGDAILVNEERCMGCKTCMMACPFGAIDLVPVYRDGEPVLQRLVLASGQEAQLKERMVASKCDLCSGRAEGPACVLACPQKALNVVSLKAEKKKRNAAAAINLLESVKQYF